MAKDQSKLYSATQLINELNVSDKYLRRLMTDLSKAGFIKSVQGRDGGYSFSKKTNQIRLIDVIHSVEGIDKFNGCVLGFDKCSSSNPCAMHDTWQHVSKTLNKVFNDTMLSDMDFSKIMRY